MFNKKKKQQKEDMLTEKQRLKQNQEKNASIMLALELEQAFKMMSYRIIPTDNYVERCKEIVQYYIQQTTFKDAENRPENNLEVIGDEKITVE